eukprot:tig00000478_g1281.t1
MGTRSALLALLAYALAFSIVGAAEENSLIADAGRNMAVTLPAESVKLYGNGGYGPGFHGEGMEYRWEQASGPAVQAQGTNARQLVLFPVEPGRYVFRLTVVDPENDNAASDMVEVVVTGESGAPEVDAGRDVTVVLPTKSVQLVGQARDPNTPMTYLWKFEKGPGLVGLAGKESRTLQVMFVNPVEGVYEFSFTATDATGLASTDTVNVVLQQSNRAPSIVPAAAVTIMWPQNEVQLSVEASDEDGRVASYAWRQVEGPPAEIAGADSPTASIRLPRTGSYAFNVTVTDNNGASAEESFPVFCGQPPAVVLQPDVYVIWPQDSVKLVAQVNGAAAGTEYLWRVESGPSVVGLGGKFSPTLDVFKLVRGTYEFSLTATDKAGMSTSARTTVRVVEQLLRPRVSAGPDVDLPYPQNSVQLQARASDEDGRVSRIEWAIEGGPAGKVKIAGRDSPVLTVADLAQGTYLFSVTVWDDMALNATDEVLVRVRDARGEVAPLQSRRSAPGADEATGPRVGRAGTVLVIVLCAVLGLGAAACVGVFFWERRRRAQEEARMQAQRAGAMPPLGRRGPGAKPTSPGPVSAKEATSYKPFTFFDNL